MSDDTCVFRHVDVDKIANGETGDVDEVHPQEEPNYRSHLAALRYEPSSWRVHEQWPCCFWSMNDHCRGSTAIATDPKQQTMLQAKPEAS